MAINIVKILFFVFLLKSDNLRSWEIMNKPDQAKQKLLNYIDDFIDSDCFQVGIIALRKKFDIPSSGFDLPEKLKRKLIQNIQIESFTLVPPEIENKKPGIIKEIHFEIKELSKNFPIYDNQTISIFKIYLFYNTKLYEALQGSLDEINLCRIEDIKDELEEYEFFGHPKDVAGIFKKKFDDYPIALKLHPSISQRDLVDYVKHNWHIINFYLSQYRDKESMLGKIRNKNSEIKKRDKFIYENRHLSHKEISSLVSKNFKEVSDVINEGSVGKIISLEKKRRKQV
jgi:hypothetical protein